MLDISISVVLAYVKLDADLLLAQRYRCALSGLPMIDKSAMWSARWLVRHGY